MAALPVASFDDADCMSAPLVRLLELVLGAVVQSEEKAAFVRDIMAMDASVQVDLVATIEKVMAHGVNSPTTADNQTSEEEEGDAEGTVLTGTPVAEARSPYQQRAASGVAGFRSPLHLSANADFERVKRENAVLRDENVRVLTNLNAAVVVATTTHAECCSCCCCRFISVRSSTTRGKSCSTEKLRTKRSSLRYRI